MEKKSDPTIDKAVDMDLEKRKLVKKVTLPAITRHIMDLTRLRAVVSEKLAVEVSMPSLVPAVVRYRCLVSLNFSSSALAVLSLSRYFCCLRSYRWIFWSIWRSIASLGVFDVADRSWPLRGGIL